MSKIDEAIVTLNKRKRKLQEMEKALVKIIHIETFSLEFRREAIEKLDGVLTQIADIDKNLAKLESMKGHTNEHK